MTEKEKKRLEKNAYQRGFYAGRKRTEDEEAQWLRVHGEIHQKHKDNERQIYCAALQGVLATSRIWRTDGAEVNTTDMYVTLAKDITDATPRRFK